MRNNPVQPVVGMGATITIGSDSYAATIIGIYKNGREVEVQRDTAKIVSGSRLDGTAEYIYEKNPLYPMEVYTMRKTKHGVLWSPRGVSSRHGPHLTIGVRESYYDPSF